MRYQPQGFIQVSRSNRFSRTLAAVVVAGSTMEHVHRKTSAVNTVAAQPGLRMVGLKCTGSGKQLEFDLAPLVTSNGVGTGDYTLFALVDAVSEATARCLYSQKNDALGAPYAQVGLYVNASDFSPSFGTLSVSAYNASAGGFGAEAAGAINGGINMYMAVYKAGTGFTMYRNGLAISTAPHGTPGAIYTAGQKTAIGADGGTGNNPYNRIVALAGSFNSALTAAEALDFASNPWQLFGDPDEWDDIAAVGAGGSVSESGSATDSCGVMLISAVAVAEAVAAMEALLGAASAGRSMAEAAPATDQGGAQLSATCGTAEAGSGTDLVGASAAMTVAHSEDASASESISSSISSSAAAITEAMSAVDLAGGWQLAAVSAVEGVSSVDASGVTASMAVSLAEVGMADDSVNSAGAVVPVAMDEAAFVFDLATAVAQLVSAIAEAVASSASISALMAAVASQVEIAGATDLLSAILEGEVVFARAPTGSGYKPRRSEAQSRPTSVAQARTPATQRNDR